MVEEDPREIFHNRLNKSVEDAMNSGISAEEIVGALEFVKSSIKNLFFRQLEKERRDIQ